MNFNLGFAVVWVLALGAPGTGLASGFETLVHHWNFDEGPDWHDDPFQAVVALPTALDLVGSAHLDVSAGGGACWVSGKQYRGLSLDAFSEAPRFESDLAPVLRGTATLSFWIRTTQLGDNVLAQAPVLLGSVGVQWGWLDGAGRIALGVGGVIVAGSTTPVNDGEWHHIVLERDGGSGAVSVRVDGRLEASANGPTATAAGVIRTLGRLETGSSRRFTGSLDQIHLFNALVDAPTREALADNHAPKTWPISSDGESGDSFTTASALMNSHVYDAEQDVLSITSHTRPEHGGTALNPDGSFTYTPESGFTGRDSFAVTIHDGRGGFAVNEVNVRVSVASTPGAGNRTTTFTGFTALEAGGGAISLTGWRVPRVRDWDGDGDGDLVIGSASGIWLYLNSGTPTAPVFAAGVRVQAAGADIALTGAMLMTFADLDGDGSEDLIVVDGSRKVRLYRNLSNAGQVPAFAAASLIASSEGGDFVLPDQRFDTADWDGDGLTDLVMGNWAGEARVYFNIGSASSALFDPASHLVIEDAAYNLFPRVYDLNRNGTPDLVRGINWGSINYWFDPEPGTAPGEADGALVVTRSPGEAVDMKAVTDGAMVDFFDLNGDDVLDVLIGGHFGGQTSIAYGVAATVADSLAAIESIYEAHPGNLGQALAANNEALLGEIKAAHANLLMHLAASNRSEREDLFARLAAHVGKYPFLQMAAPLDTGVYRHLPSVAGQNLMTLHESLPDTPGHRTAVANAVGLTGLHREIYLRMGLHVGDNQRSTRGQLESIRDFMHLQPRESFPDAAITLDHYYGDGRAGWVSSFRGAKNTFHFGEGENVSEWAADLDAAAVNSFGSEVQRGDYFTFVMGHEVTHSLDGYVINRANRDLWRRKGQVLTLAAGPDVLSAAGDDRDVWDWDVTKARFQSRGLWNGNPDSWDAAWSAYWTSGPGAVYKDLSFMRGNIDWFLANPQEAMATQANHHWAHAEARLVGAIARWRRGVEDGIEPMKANLTEVLTFLDWISCGMNKIVMQDTEGVASPYPRAVYHTRHAWLERDEKGYLTRVTVGERDYRFAVDGTGIVTAILDGGQSGTVLARPTELQVVKAMPRGAFSRIALSVRDNSTDESFLTFWRQEKAGRRWTSWRRVSRYTGTAGTGTVRASVNVPRRVPLRFRASVERGSEVGFSNVITYRSP